MTLERQQTCSKAAAACGIAFAGLKSFLKNEDGVTAIEYGLLAALIVIAASGAVSLVGGGVHGMWTTIAAKVGAALGV
jgi:pilus assembly protein Flp/PilA